MTAFPQVRLKVHILILAGLLSLSPIAKADSTHIPTALVIHSYNIEYAWTADVHSGILQRINSMDKAHLVYTEFLDWKRFPDEALVARALSVLSYKYRGKPIDVIIVTDDKALETVVRNRNELFEGIPIVFTGVYREALPSLVGSERGITGIFEDQDVKTTIRYALGIQPRARAAYIVSDINESGQAVESRLAEALKAIAPTLRVISLSDLPIEAIEKRVQGFSPEDVLFIGSYSIDSEGTTFTGETLIGKIASASKAPVYVLNTHHLGTGALGGNLLSPYLLGVAAGDLAVRILAGESADAIKPHTTGIHTPLFDQKVADRFGLSGFPPNASFINREQSIFQKYRWEISGIALVFLLLVVFIQILALNVRKTKMIASDLAARNDELVSLKAHLEASEERFRLCAIGSNDALWDWDASSGKAYRSDRWYEMTGYQRDRLAEDDIPSLIHPDDRKRFKAAAVRHTSGETSQLSDEVRIKCADGSWKWILIRGRALHGADGSITRFAGSITDIDVRKQERAEIESLAYYDQLTSLPNRARAMAIAEEAMDETPDGQICALLLVDIDDFKFVNDTYGHSTGDKILLYVASALSSLSNETIKIARVSGDEFVVIASRTTALAADRLGGLIVKLVSRKVEIDGRFHYPSVSVGVATWPDHGTNFDELLGKADAALHRAKAMGKGRHLVFDEDIRLSLVKRMRLESGLRSALDNKEIYVAYQPQVSIQTGGISGFEALARWTSDSYGEISPASFIPIAEATGQIDRIGMFVLRSAIEFVKRAEPLGISDFTVSVNISVRQLSDANFAQRVIRLLREEGVDAARFVLEITESIVIDGVAEATERLEQLRDAGFKIALDDFGKGYSSLAYLKTLPINCVKIDKAFIDDILTEEKTRVLARSIVLLSHQLGFTVIAEGVESNEQLEYLRECDCDSFQGYLFSKPTSEGDAIERLRLAH